MVNNTDMKFKSIAQNFPLNQYNNYLYLYSSNEMFPPCEHRGRPPLVITLCPVLVKGSLMLVKCTVQAPNARIVTVFVLRKIDRLVEEVVSAEVILE